MLRAKKWSQSYADDKRGKPLRAGKSLPRAHTSEARRAAPPSWVALGLSPPGFTFSLFAWYLFDPSVVGLSC